MGMRKMLSGDITLVGDTKFAPVFSIFENGGEFALFTKRLSGTGTYAVTMQGGLDKASVDVADWVAMGGVTGSALGGGPQLIGGGVQKFLWPVYRLQFVGTGNSTVHWVIVGLS